MPNSARTSALRAAAIRRVNRQTAAVTDTVRAWKALRDVEKVEGDTHIATLALRAALDNLECEMEKK